MTIDTQNNNLLGLLNSNPKYSTSAALSETSEQDQYSPEDYGASLERSTDRVSISYRASKLNDISQKYFGGTIGSSDIAALTQSLFEGGFLTEEEFVSLGGQTQQVSITSESVNFLNRYMGSGEKLTNEQGKGIINAISVIENMNQNPTDLQLENEQKALSFINGFVMDLADKDTDEKIQQGFEQVQTVLSKLSDIRNGNVDIEALNSYQEIQQLQE